MARQVDDVVRVQDVWCLQVAIITADVYVFEIRLEVGTCSRRGQPRSFMRVAGRQAGVGGGGRHGTDGYEYLPTCTSTPS